MKMSLRKQKRNVIESDSDSDFEEQLQNKCFYEFSIKELSDLQDGFDPAYIVKWDTKCERI